MSKQKEDKVISWPPDKIRRVPEISDEQIEEMRERITPCLPPTDDEWVREIKNWKSLHPRNVSFLWDAQPDGEEFTFKSGYTPAIITQHYSTIFFKPSLAEVYAWILFYFPESWREITHFWLEEPDRIFGSTDCYCLCRVAFGPKMIRGEPLYNADGDVVGYEVIQAPDPSETAE